MEWIFLKCPIARLQGDILLPLEPFYFVSKYKSLHEPAQDKESSFGSRFFQYLIER